MTPLSMLAWGARRDSHRRHTIYLRSLVSVSSPRIRVAGQITRNHVFKELRRNSTRPKAASLPNGDNPGQPISCSEFIPLVTLRISAAFEDRGNLPPRIRQLCELRALLLPVPACAIAPGGSYRKWSSAIRKTLFCECAGEDQAAHV